MENSARQERQQDQQQKDIASIQTEIKGLTVTLVGIDGKNGMRSQINDLASEINELKNCFHSYMTDISESKFESSKNILIFSTKKELKETENKILDKVDEIKKDHDNEKKEREEDKIERKRHLEILKTSRWVVIASLLGILVSSVLNYID